MSKPPNSRASFGRTPSAEPENRRASVHSLNLSYAYGAPTNPTVRRQSSLGPEEDARTDMTAAGSGNRTASALGESGRAAEPAAVRYARLAQRKKDTGGNAYPPPPPVPTYSAYQNTSVNIANAFKAATSGLGGVVTGGRQEDFPANADEDDDEEADQEENAGEDEDAEDRRAERDDLEDAEEEEGEENGPPDGKAPSDAARKRKKHGARDPAQRDPAEQSSSSEESGREGTQHQNKRTKVHSDDNDHVDDPAAINKPRRRPQKSADPTYRPLADPNYRAGQTTTSDSDGDSPKRRRSKGKGRTSAGGRSIAQEAIPRGIRDGEIWYGKKRKARRSSRPASTTGERGSGEPDGETGAGAAHSRPADELGGMDPSGHDYTGEQDHDGEEGDATPSGATYFLRLKSPSPPSSSRTPAALQSNVGASTSRTTVDPAFAAFDRSLGQTGQDSNSLTASFDDSVLRGSSYDYSEEERIVQALEAQKRRRIGSQLEARQQQPTPQRPTPQQPARSTHAPTPQTAGNTATPVISNGGYPATPNAAPVSPVTALRRRRLPGPPSVLGAGTPLAAADNGDELERAEKMGGELGRKLGNVLRPLIQLAGRLWQRSQNPLLNWPRILKAVALAAFAVSIVLAALYHDSIPLPGRKAISATTYVPPAVVPDSLEGVISRLADLESAVGRLSSASGTDRQLATSDRKAAKELQNIVRELEHTLHEGQARSHSALSSLDQAATQRAKENGQAIKLVKAEVAALATQVRQANDLQRTDAVQLRSLQSDVGEVTSSLAALQSQVTKVVRDVRDTGSVDRITKVALDAIGKKLPGKVAVWMDESGRLDIDPSFWRVLKDAFIDKKAVEKTFDAKLASLDGAKRQSLFGSSSKEVKAPSAPSALSSWDTFLAENEAALRAWISSDLSERSESGAFVSRRTFLDLLDRKIQTLRRDFETNVHDNFEQMGRELLAKVAKQDDMRRKDAARDLHSNPFARSGQTGHGETLTIKGTDGQNVTQVISSLVDSALLRYSKDVLARPDYALYTSGGRVIRSLTSKSYEPYRLGKVRSAVAWVTGAAVPHSRPPVTALHPDTSPGSCWPFAGPHGQLGIQLSRRVIPTDITLEHISPDVALDGDVSSAPKDFEVWGIVDDVAQVARVAQYRQDQLQAKRAARAAGTATEDDLSAPASLPESANHVLLASGAYDPSASSPVQTFPVTAAARQLSIPVQIVVIKILSNHGESAYTCLYRIRVSGSTPAQLEAGSST